MRVNFRICFVLVVLCLAAFRVCGAEKTVTDKVQGFEITLPEDWIESKEPGKGFERVSPLAKGAKGSARIRIVAFEGPARDSAKELADGLQKKLAEKLPGFVLIDRSELKINGLAASKIAYEYDEEGEKVSQTMHYLVKGKRVWRISISLIKADVEIYGKQIESMANTFKVIEAK